MLQLKSKRFKCNVSTVGALWMVICLMHRTFFLHRSHAYLVHSPASIHR
jgi:hypothetical protein